MSKIYSVGLSFMLIATNVVRCKPDYLIYKEAGGWLKLHRTPATWQEAYLRCHYEDAVLASPIAKPLADALESQMSLAGVTGPIYLGTQSLFSTGNFFSLEGVPLSKMNVSWGSHQDAMESGDCLMMFTNDRSSYLVAVSSCVDRRPFICYKKLEINETMNECGTFDNEYHLMKCTGSCYKVHKQAVTWSQAFGICAAEGGHLVILNDKYEAHAIKKMYPEGTLSWHRFHIGLGALTDDRIWTTIHGENIEDVYNVWGPNQPEEQSKDNRASLGRDGRLYDADSDDYKSIFVCEKSPQSIQFERIKVVQNAVTPLVPEVS